MSQKSIAIIGASSNRSKYGNKAVRAWKQAGYTVYPINPKDDTIEGLKVYRSVSDLPEPPDYANLYVAPAIGIKLLEEIAKKGIKEVFANPGADSEEMVERGNELGITVMRACSIVATGKTPMDFPDE
ncbi:MAG: CoA-binding protein [Nitrospirota bacterium]|nr:CoA-binding protein [Nitrospirota bacterium]